MFLTWKDSINSVGCRAKIKIIRSYVTIKKYNKKKCLFIAREFHFIYTVILAIFLKKKILNQWKWGNGEDDDKFDKSSTSIGHKYLEKKIGKF